MTRLLLALLLLPLCARAIPADVEVYFSPNGGCTAAIVREIDAAKETIHLPAYSFTSAPIAKALTDAHKRGVTVIAILDKSNRTGKYSAASFLAHAGIPTFIDDRHAIQHNKVILIDGRTVITGSFNFSKAAEENNAENLLIIQSPVLFAEYLADWENHLAHSKKF